MKTLFIAPQLPWPLDQGARIRNYYLLRALAAAGHTVDLLCLDVGGQGGPSPLTQRDELDTPLLEFCRRVEWFPAPTRKRGARLRALVQSPLPDLAHRAWEPCLAARVRALTAQERYDVVQISSLEMMPYRKAVAVHAGERPRVVFDDLNAEYQLQRRACVTDLRQPRRWHAALYSGAQWLRLRAYERRLCREADAVVAVSAADAALLRRLAPEGRYVVVPNGVDTAAFPYRPARPAEPPELLFTGTMDYRPNVDAVLWFAAAILPRLRRAHPALRCLIVGKAPDARLLAAARRAPGLEVTGMVPAVQPYLARAAVYVVPMRMGSGTRLKVLEAMAAGVPVVSTRLGMEGIAANPEAYARLADTPAAFAAAVLAVLHDPPAAARQAARARALVEQRLDWARVAPGLAALHEALL